MSDLFYVVMKEPGRPPVGRFVGNGSASPQKIVGGNLERVVCDCPEGLSLFVNEDARQLDLPKNITLDGSNDDLRIVRGTCFLQPLFDAGEMTTNQMVEAGQWFREKSL